MDDLATWAQVVLAAVGLIGLIGSITWGVVRLVLAPIIREQAEAKEWREKHDERNSEGALIELKKDTEYIKRDVGRILKKLDMNGD